MVVVLQNQNCCDYWETNNDHGGGKVLSWQIKKEMEETDRKNKELCRAEI